ncbi:cytochrome b/b6 domain-containing protein [Acidisoma sp. C75]
MWLLLADGLAYLLYGVASGHFRRDMSPPPPAAVARDLAAALRLQLRHRIGQYNAVQRLAYAGVLVLIIQQAASGLAIWKPVQFGWLAGLFSGYPTARGIHLALMLGIGAFILLHLALVALHPETLKAIVVQPKVMRPANHERSIGFGCRRL